MPSKTTATCNACQHSCLSCITPHSNNISKYKCCSCGNAKHFSLNSTTTSSISKTSNFGNMGNNISATNSSSSSSTFKFTTGGKGGGRIENRVNNGIWNGGSGMRIESNIRFGNGSAANVFRNEMRIGNGETFLNTAWPSRSSSFHYQSSAGTGSRHGRESGGENRGVSGEGRGEEPARESVGRSEALSGDKSVGRDGDENGGARTTQKSE